MKEAVVVVGFILVFDIVEEEEKEVVLGRLMWSERSGAAACEFVVLGSRKIPFKGIFFLFFSS